MDLEKDTVRFCLLGLHAASQICPGVELIRPLGAQVGPLGQQRRSTPTLHLETKTTSDSKCLENAIR